MSTRAFARPRRTVRHLLTGVAALTALVALAACSSTSDTAQADDAAGPRIYESEFGPVELPASIERIVSIDFYTPAALVDLGVYPVGVVNSYFTEGAAIPEQYKTAVAENGAESIGEYYELNLEAVAEAAPDLIIATNDFLPLDDPLRPELEKLAPILTFQARDGESWRTRSTALAEILDKEAELAPFESAYNERRDAIKATYADILTDYSYAVFVPTPDGWGTYADTHFSTPILRDLGATFREQEADEINEFGFPNWFSYERLDRLSNADVLLANLGADAEVLASVEANTIWKNLPAVQAGMVVDYIPLSPTGSFGWAMENLDDLEAMLAQVQAKVDGQG